MRSSGCGRSPAVKRAAEPPFRRWIKRPRGREDPLMHHFLDTLAASVVVYASVTRGGLLFARLLGRIAGT